MSRSRTCAFRTRKTVATGRPTFLGPDGLIFCDQNWRSRASTARFLTRLTKIAAIDAAAQGSRCDAERNHGSKLEAPEHNATEANQLLISEDRSKAC